MQEIASYYLAVLGGNASPSVVDLTKILSKAGNIQINEEKLKAVVKSLGSAGDIEALIKEGSSKLATVSAAPSGAAATSAAAAAPAAASGKKAEEKKKEESESDEDMGFALFD